jgi:hypothetical protein
MPVRDGIHQAFARRCPPVAPGHVGRGAALVQEHEARRLHVALPHPPAAAMPGHVGPILLRGPQALFLYDNLSRRSVSEMVESAFTMMPRA